MKIQFLNPPVHHYAGIRYKMLPLLSLPVLTAWFNRHGHEAEAVDLEALGVTPERFEQRWREQRDRWPDAVGVTGLDISKRGMREIIQSLRRAGFDRPIMAGGCHMTVHPQAGLDWGADLVVTGECEGNIIELVESGATGIHAGVPAPIEEIPAPDWLHFSPWITSYESNIPRLLMPAPAISMWARGCPFSCIFCSNIVFGRRQTRYRPPQNIEAELIQLKQYGARHIYVYDDEMVGTHLPDGWMRDIADRIAPLGFKWITQGRCSKRHITPELMADMKRAGCTTVFWGVESFSPKVLEAVKKGTTPEDIWHTLRVSRAAGIDNAVFTMVGNYRETDSDLAMTAEALRQAYAEGLIQMRQTTITTPMPGTRLAEIAKDEGWYREPPDFGEQMLQHSPTPWLPAERASYWMSKFHEVCPVGLA
jgi:anaerobic magnesium-protoporphyrin IX monomethyl ester cyclase